MESQDFTPRGSAAIPRSEGFNIRRMAVAGGLGSLALLMVGCGGGGESVASSRTATTAASTTIPAEVAMTDLSSKDGGSGQDLGASKDDGPSEADADLPGDVPAGASDGALPGGRSLVFIHEVLPDEGALIVDLAQYFEGPAADRAARGDGAIGPTDQIDGGRYVRNANSRLRTVSVRSGSVDLIDLASTMSSTPEANAYFVSVDGGWITGISPANLGTN